MSIHRILVIGTGSIGERHLRCFQATGRATVGIVELRGDLREAVAERYQMHNAYSSVDEALTDSWDAAVIATPAATHIPIALQLAESGVALFIEKPLSTTVGDVEKLIGLADKNGLVAAVAYVYRAHPALAAMRNAIQSERFGKPLQMTAVCGQHFPLYRPAYRETYYADRAQGGGAIQDALTHVLNAGEWLVGPIERLCADAAHQSLEGVDVEDTVHLLARHGTVMGSYALNQHQAPNEMTVTVVCERGALRFEMHHQRWAWMAEPGGEWNVETAEIVERDDWFIRQEHAFLDTLEGKSAPLCSLHEGYQTLKVNLAALASADNETGWLEP
jgi:predicted dehydrogenase